MRQRHCTANAFVDRRLLSSHHWGKDSLYADCEWLFARKNFSNTTKTFWYYTHLLLPCNFVDMLCVISSLSPSVVKQHVGYDAEQHTWQDDLWSERSKKGIETNSFYMINFRSRGAFARRVINCIRRHGW